MIAHGHGRLSTRDGFQAARPQSRRDLSDTVRSPRDPFVNLRVARGGEDPVLPQMSEPVDTQTSGDEVEKSESGSEVWAGMDMSDYDADDSGDSRSASTQPDWTA